MLVYLKPCPFCGSTHLKHQRGWFEGTKDVSTIECSGCDVLVAAEPDHWNQRAGDEG